MSEKELAILAVARSIPVGKVATYGQIARLAGYPRNSRQVGSVMKKLPSGSSVPWHRIVNSNGFVAERSGSFADDSIENYQRELLESEGVCLDSRGRVDLSQFQWVPNE